MPTGGLFHEKSWRVSPDPFPVPAAFAARLEKLGYQLARFLDACDELYRLSADGRQPPWIAELLDRGKPAHLVALGRERRFRGETARVIRPDLVLTEKGFIIAELDNVPGGIGLTAWLHDVYAPYFPGLLGGADGMLDGFASIFPGGEIVVSDEAATYRPEMEWLANRLCERSGEPGRWRVRGAHAGGEWSARVYRFFELFDEPNVPCFDELAGLVLDGRVEVTPPFKPALEEKIWFALFWLKPLEAFWLRALGGNTLAALREVIPYTWPVDPAPLPPHAVLPRLDVHGWDEVARFSQKQRALILKISGFHETAWGARGVVLGSDVPSAEWASALRGALDAWPDSPHLLQQFHPARTLVHPCLSDDAIVPLRGRVRLCPYYFRDGGRAPRLGGALATICPDDKKLLHGMPDAILVPTAIVDDGG